MTLLPSFIKIHKLISTLLDRKDTAYTLTQHTIHLSIIMKLGQEANYEGWNFNSGNYLFTTVTK